MKYKYIAIEREYGSGGTKIARQVAQACKIPCYGREILEIVAAEQKIAVEEIERYEETVTNSFLYTLYMLGKAQDGAGDMLTREGQVFLAEQAVIKRLAADGSAVFLGRCAAEALQNANSVLRVFIYSDREDKLKRIKEDYGILETEAESMMRRFDKKRSNYYYANTTRKWNHPANYDLVLDSGKLGIHGCAAAICGVFCQK